jgi:hypothetical protein
MSNNLFFFRKSCRLWDNVEKYGTARQAADHDTIRRMRFAWWIPKATNTHSQYVILIAFPLQQWLHERASILRYTYIACLVWQNLMRFKIGCGRVATFLELHSTCAEFKFGFSWFIPVPTGKRRGSISNQLMAASFHVPSTSVLTDHASIRRWWPERATDSTVKRTDIRHRSTRCKCKNCQGRIHGNKSVHKTAHPISPFQ